MSEKNLIIEMTDPSTMICVPMDNIISLELMGCVRVTDLFNIYEINYDFVKFISVSEMGTDGKKERLSDCEGFPAHKGVKVINIEEIKEKYRKSSKGDLSDEMFEKTFNMWMFGREYKS